MSNQTSSGVPVPDDLVLVGYISGAWALAGWVRIRPYSPDADALLHAKTWWIDRPELHDVEMLQAKTQGEDVIAQLMGVADRNAAEALKGTAVSIRRSHFPPLDNDEFYWIDLIGLAVENLRGEPLGVVHDLMDNGAHPILRVSVAAGTDIHPAPVAATPDSSEPEPTLKPKELLIPFVDRFVKTVDQVGKKITVDWELDF